MQRVLVAVEGAGHVAAGVQAVERLVVAAQDAQVIVDLDAAHGGKHRGNALDGVERGLLDGEVGQEVGAHAEVVVVALLDQLVVAGDGGDEVLSVDAVALGQLLEGVGLLDGSSLQEVLPVALGVGVLAGVAVGVREVIGGLAVVEPVGVADLEGDLLGLQGDGGHNGLVVHVLVAEALAVDVDAQPRDAGEGRVALGQPGGVEVHHQGVGRGGDLRADPGAHAHAVAGVVGIAVQAADAGEQRAEALYHLRVVGHVATGQQDALGGVHLDVLAVGVLADDASDGCAVLGGAQAHRGGVPQHLGAGLLGLVAHEGEELREAGVAALEVVGVEPADGLPLLDDLGLDLGGLVEDPVHDLATALDEHLHQDAVLTAVGVVDEVREQLGGVEGLAAGLEPRLVVDGVGAPAVGDGVVALLEHDGAQAVGGRVQGRGGTAGAQADDADVAVDGLGDLVVGDVGGLLGPAPGSLSGGLGGLVGHRETGRGSGAHCGSGGSGNKTTA